MSSEVPQLPAGLLARPSSKADADALLRLMQDWDLAEIGEVDSDLADAEMRLPATADDQSQTATLVWAKGELVAAACLAGDEGEVLVCPALADGPAVEAALLSWLVSKAERSGRRLRLMVLADALERQARYANAGLEHRYSML